MARSFYFGLANYKSRRVEKKLLRCRSCSVALLILLAGAAGARIISPDFGLPANDLLRRGVAVRSRHARLLQLFFLATLELRFQVVHRSRCAFARRWRSLRLVAVAAGCGCCLLGRGRF